MDKTIQTYKDKSKIEYKIGIIGTFANEKIDVQTALKVHGKCGTISTFKHIKTEERRMKTRILNRFNIKIKKRPKNAKIWKL